MIRYIICFVCFFNILNAQDTIYNRSGQIISAKIIEISISEIKYKRFDMQDGPLFITNKNDIEKIKFANGTFENFKVSENRDLQIESGPIQLKSEKISIYRNTFYYKNKRFSDRGILYLIEDKNALWKDKSIQESITLSQKNKKLQYSFGFGGAGLAILSMIASGIILDNNMTMYGTRNNTNNTGAALVALNGVGLLIASQVLSFNFKLKRIKHAKQTVEFYNTHL